VGAEILAAIAAANSAFKLLSKTARSVSSVADDIDNVNRGIGQTLDKFWAAKELLSAHEKKAKTPSRVERIFRQSEVADNAAEIVFARDDLNKKEQALKEIMIYSGRGDLYTDLQKERRKIRQEKARKAAQAAKDRAFFIDCCFIAGVVVLFGVALWVFVMFIT
tara:strand:- start:1637 stop:2128 length:492 start_codon:yes stop_codon:yes gene_type:complete